MAERGSVGMATGPKAELPSPERSEFMKALGSELHESGSADAIGQRALLRRQRRAEDQR